MYNNVYCSWHDHNRSAVGIITEQKKKTNSCPERFLILKCKVFYCRLTIWSCCYPHHTNIQRSIHVQTMISDCCIQCSPANGVRVITHRLPRKSSCRDPCSGCLPTTFFHLRILYVQCDGGKYNTQPTWGHSVCALTFSYSLAIFCKHTDVT